MLIPYRIDQQQTYSFVIKKTEQESSSKMRNTGSLLHSTVTFKTAVCFVFLLLILSLSVFVSHSPARAITDDINSPSLSRGEHVGKPCNCVVFRIDDIQDEWIDTVQTSLLDHFIKAKERVSVGLIMNALGNDTTVTNKISEGLANGTIELVSHGWNHVNYTKLSPEQQRNTLRQANEKMENIWGIGPNAFIPPYNAYDNNTLAALQALKMKIISSEFDLELPSIYDPDMPNGPDNKVFRSLPQSGGISRGIADDYGIFHLPQVVGFYTYPDSSDVSTKTPLSNMINSINSAVASYGYAVVTLHPEEFAVKLGANQEPTNKISTKELADLDALIERIHVEGYSLKTYSQVVWDYH